MVAITVILAAVIAAFVLGLGDTSEPAPQVSFDYDYNETGEFLNVTVQSGDIFDAGNADVAVEGETQALEEFTSFNSGSSVSAGNSFSINASDGFTAGVSSGDRVDITFTPDGGGESNILGTFTAPDS
jgi:Protein of unknown function (DUF1628).